MIPEARLPLTVSQITEVPEGQDTVTATMQFCSYVDGAWRAGDGPRVDRVNPADPDDVVTTYTQADSRVLGSAVRGADAAFVEWDRLGYLQRGRVLADAARCIRERAELIAAKMTAEHGKMLSESRLEVEATAQTFEYHAATARNPIGVEYPSARDDERIVTVRRPLGPVGVITPWNFPAQIPAWKIAPALLHGNTVIWKPASNTPGVSVLLMRALADAGLPAGVVNLVLGSGRLGAELVASPQVRAVTFTGSVPVGQAIRQVVSNRGGKLQMELGGHNPALVLPDAEPEHAADTVVAAAMSSTGQKCTATRRVILVGSGHERLIDLIRAKVAALRVGPGSDPQTQVGPVVSRQARKEVLDSIDLATREGAEVLAQASVPAGGGAYVPPTVLTGPTSMTICREEVFGPVVVVLRAQDLNEAIALANDTPYGLSASVFTRDEASIRRCIRDIAAGLIKVNAPTTGSELHAPFGGLKDSTFPGPREQNAAAAAAFFTIEKTAYLRVAPGTRA